MKMKSTYKDSSPQDRRFAGLLVVKAFHDDVRGNMDEDVQLPAGDVQYLLRCALEWSNVEQECEQRETEITRKPQGCQV